MKVLIVHRLVAAFGGAHKYLRYLVQILGSSGFEVHLAINPSAATQPFVDQLKEYGVVVHYVDYDNLSSQAAGDVFDKLLGSIHPQVIDFEAAAKSVRSFAMNSVRFAEIDASKVFTMHLPIVTDQSLLRGWRAKLPFSHGRSALEERRAFVNLFDRGISVSRYHAESICKLLRLPISYFTIIPNGVDTSVFSPSGGLESNPRIVIAACGGLTKQKRFDVLVNAADRLTKTGVDFEICIAGEGKERAALESQVQRLDLGGKVTLCGHVKDIPEFLRSADVFVLSSDSEGLPYATIEAMACGLPCVVTRVGELPFLVTNGKNGFVLECGDPELLATKIAELAADDGLRSRFGVAARKRIVEDYDQAVIETLVSDFYTELLR